MSDLAKLLVAVPIASFVVFVGMLAARISRLENQIMEMKRK